MLHLLLLIDHHCGLLAAVTDVQGLMAINSLQWSLVSLVLLVVVIEVKAWAKTFNVLLYIEPTIAGCLASRTANGCYVHRLKQV